MKTYTLAFLSLIFFSLLLTNSGFAYDINCDIKVIPYRYSELVTTDSFMLNITFQNIGNTSLPSTPFTGVPFVNVTIFNPNKEIPEDYYTFNIPLSLVVNKSFSYEPPFPYKNESAYRLFEMQMPGAWEVRLKIISPLPLNETLYTNSGNVIRTNGECRKYFYVKDFGQYQDEQVSKDYQTKTENLNIAILILSIILALDLIRKFAENNKNLVIFIAGVVIAYYYLFVEPVQFLSFILPITVKIILAIIMIIFSFRVYFNEPKRKLRIIYIMFIFLILMLTILFLIRMFTVLLGGDHLLGTIGIIAGSTVIFSILKELNETKT